MFAFVIHHGRTDACVSECVHTDKAGRSVHTYYARRVNIIIPARARVLLVVRVRMHRYPNCVRKKKEITHVRTDGRADGRTNGERLSLLLQRERVGMGVV